MKLFQPLCATLLGTCALVVGAGCAQDAGDLDMTSEAELGAPEPTEQGLFGSLGTNNLNPVPFHQNRGALLTSTQSAFGAYSAGAGTWWVANNPSNSTLLSTLDGQKVIKYAMRCSADTATTVHAQVGATVLDFPGQGLLTTAGDWLKSPLANSAAQDLFGCMLAHLNARGVEVPINLSGPSVADNPDGADDFTWAEALWVAKLTPGGGKSTFSFNVWPLEDVETCANYVGQLTSRVCGTYSGNCGLTVRSDRATACVQQSDGWYCNVGGATLPAIKTRLKVTDVESLYDNCP